MANALAEGHDFFQIANRDISPNEQILAYADDTVGRRQFTIHFKDLNTGKISARRIKEHVRIAGVGRRQQDPFLCRERSDHVVDRAREETLLGTDAAKDPVVYEERDHSYYMGVGRTRDEKYIVIEEHSTLSDGDALHSRGPAEGEIQGFRTARTRFRIQRRSHQPSLDRAHELEREELSLDGIRRQQSRRQKTLERIHPRRATTCSSAISRCSRTISSSANAATDCSASASSRGRAARNFSSSPTTSTTPPPSAITATGHRRVALRFFVAHHAEHSLRP